MSSPTMPVSTNPVPPLPKWVGIVAAIGVLVGSMQAALNDATVATLLAPKTAAVLASVCGVIILISHSLTGTGGK